MRLSKLTFYIFTLLLFVACSSDNGGGGPTPPTDNQAPSSPSNVNVSNVTENSAELDWTASTDNVGVTLYRIFDGNTLLKTSGSTSTTLTGLTKDTQYSIQISARDAAGNESGKSAAVSFTTLGDCPTSGTLFPGQTGTSLFNNVKNCFTPTTVYTYKDARRWMYTEIDVQNDGMVHTIYTDRIVPKAPNFATATEDMIDIDINCEHIFPQSKGAGDEPARSDMFHLAPADEAANGARGSNPFDEIVDSNTDKWYYKQMISNSIPTSSIDDWSEFEPNEWEPREEVKGDVARAVFYFMVIHNTTADQNFFNGMKATLLNWHDQDPVDSWEMERNNRIKGKQGNDNPFIIDPDLADRMF